jgi:long-chain acyl-CoA synthetase
MNNINLLNLYFNSINKYGSNILFNTPNTILGKKKWTYESVDKLTNKFKFLFAQNNICKNDRILYLGDNSPQWFGANIACYQLKGIFVPVYKSQHTDVINHIVNETKPKIIMGSLDLTNKINPELIKNIKPNILDLDKIIYEDIPEFKSIQSFSSDDSINIILYTSGTTGLAKGVCLSQNNLCSNILSIDKKIGTGYINQNDKYFNFLPWSHIYGLNCELYYGMSKGASIFINDEVKNIASNMKKSNPTIICSVPKLLYSIYDKLESNKISKIIISKHPFNSKPFDKVIGKIIKNFIFGSNLRFINSGGAPISPHILNFYSNLNIPVYQGYGLSETSPLVSLNYPSNNKIGSVGKILDCNEVKIVNDEILVKGSNVFSGYYLNQIETLNVFDSGGYFKTGDQGYIDPDGYLFITGRCKDLYKLTNGKYINPAHIENILMESEHIQQIFIYGDSKPYNIALVVSNSSSNTILSEINKLSKKLKKYEIPEKILIVPPFTFEEKLLTAKLSLIRNNIVKKYANQIENLYTN